jgi:hypothetical protein
MAWTSLTTPHRATAARTPIRLAVLGLEVIDPMADAEMVAAE